MKMTIRSILLLLLFASLILCENLDNQTQEISFQQFQSFMQNYSKSYKSIDELNARFNIFVQNKIDLNITSFNDEISEDVNWKEGASPFFDMTPDEFSKTYLTFTNESLPSNMQIYNFTSNDDSTNEELINDDVETNNNTSQLNFLASNNKAESHPNRRRNLQTVPSSWDWRSFGAVTSVKYQGVCGACWAFVSVANIEGLHYIKYKNLTSYSEQQILDCASANLGCNGGTAASAFYYIMRAGGLMLRSDYPYVGYKQACNFKYANASVHVTNYVTAGTLDEERIKLMLYRTGPLAVAINGYYLQFYQSGVLDVSNSYCSPYFLNHAVTLVGYGTTALGVDYWIAKNSWGRFWGEKGFFRIKRGSGTCGINRVVTSAVLR